MTVAIHQPHYLPYLGYLDKMKNCDVFVVLDNAQYEKGGWQNRNRIMGKKGVEYITIPVKRKTSYLKPITDVQVNGSKWREDHYIQLKAAYRHTPYWKDFEGRFEALYNEPYKRLVSVNMSFLTAIGHIFKIYPRIVMASHLPIESAGTQRLVDICKRLGADTYLTGTGALDYLEVEKFAGEGITLVGQKFSNPSTIRPDNLSVVDMLFNHGPDVEWHSQPGNLWEVAKDEVLEALSRV
jgi:hypothetical protein